MLKLVYKYPILAPHEGADLVEEQFRQALKYSHLLTKIERARRAAYRAMRLQYLPALVEAEDVVDQLEEELNKTRTQLGILHSKRRSKKTTPEEKRVVKEYKKKLSEAKKIRKAEREKAKDHPKVLEQRVIIDKRSIVLQKAARKVFSSKCYWGTRGLVDRAAQQARSKAKINPVFRSSINRGYRHPDEQYLDGQISIQAQGGIPAQDLMLKNGQNRLIKLGRLPPTQWNTRSGRRNAQTPVSIRIGSDKKRNPIWVSFMMTMYRPFPEEAIIKEVIVNRKKASTRTIWSIDFVLEIPDPKPNELPGTVAVHPGWRVRKYKGVQKRSDTNLRVAYLVDDKDKQLEILLNPDAVRLFNKELELLSLIDHHFNHYVDTLKKWIKREKNKGTQFPEWFEKQTQNIIYWKSDIMFTQFVERWYRKRFEADCKPVDNKFLCNEYFVWSSFFFKRPPSIFDLMWSWRNRWRHLNQYAVGARRKAIDIRRDQYRKLGLALARTYGTVILDDASYTELGRRAPTEEAEYEPLQIMRRNRVRISPGDFRATIAQRARRYGTTVRRVSTKNLTKICHHCEKICKWDAATAVRHTCEHCEREWDQDVNAAKNMLLREKRGEVLEEKEPPKPRFHKKHHPKNKDVEVMKGDR